MRPEMRYSSSGNGTRVGIGWQTFEFESWAANALNGIPNKV